MSSEQKSLGNYLDILEICLNNQKDCKLEWITEHLQSITQLMKIGLKNFDLDIELLLRSKTQDHQQKYGTLSLWTSEVVGEVISLGNIQMIV